MSSSDLLSNLPIIGDPAPAFQAESDKGTVNFPEYSRGHWCVLFAHPANFTSAWTMYASFMAMKERWLDARNTKVVALVNEPLRGNDWQEKVRRYLGIYLKAPVVEDTDFAISNLYGMASNRRNWGGYDRVFFLIDPQGIIRLIVNRPVPSIEQAIAELQRELDRLQNQASEQAPPPSASIPRTEWLHVLETTDSVGRPAYLRPKRNLILN